MRFHRLSTTSPDRSPANPAALLAMALAVLLALTGLGPVAAQAEAAQQEEAASTSTWRFDFGGAGSPVEEGWTQVANTTLYTADQGYGLDRETSFRDRGAPDAVRRDFTNAGDYHFLVDVPDGDYHVTVISGDEIAGNNTALSVEDVNQGTLTPRGAGEYSAHELFTTVTDGQIDFHFRNDGRANGIIITQVFAPTGLEVADVTLTPDTSVTLTWDAMEGAEQYTVYRSPEGEDDFTAVGSTTETSFTDGTVDLGYTYDYAVTQTTAEDIESALSEALTVSVTDPSVTPPATPENLTLDRAVRQATTFSWGPVPEALHYDVYRALSENGPFERVATVQDATYTHDGSTTVNHYYRVVAINEGGLSEPSEVLATPVTATPVRHTSGGSQGCGQGSFDAQVVKNGRSWQAINDGETVYNGVVMLDAMQAAVDSLSPGRTDQERVVVRGSGTMPADVSLDLPSHTSFEVCGTIDVTGNESSFDYQNHNAAVRIRHAEDVSVPHLSLTGNPNFGVFVRTSEDVHLGQLDLRLRGGHGLRIDSRDDDTVYGARDIRVDDVYVSGTDSHGVETYGVDGISIGTVTARDTGYSGLLLNQTINATVDLVDAVGAGTGTGYAAFRMANRNGRIDDGYPTNIRVGEVRAVGGGRGIFCVSESGGAVIDRVHISDTGSNAMLIENCHNVTIAPEGGLVEGPGDIRIAARSEFANTSDITLENFTLRNSAINERPCGENIVIRNITLQDSQINAC